MADKARWYTRAELPSFQSLPGMDCVVTASAANGTAFFVAGTTTELVREAQRRHGLAPTAAAAVGRLVTAAALLGTGLAGRERLTLQIAGDGPIGAVIADAWSAGDGAIAARGYARHPEADLPLNALGKFDVAGVIGRGRLQVTKSHEIGQPYVGIVPLQSGEIGDDVASYLANSQQIPSIVALGVLARITGICRKEALEEAVRLEAPEKFAALNLAAVQEGFALH